MKPVWELKIMVFVPLAPSVDWITDGPIYGLVADKRRMLAYAKGNWLWFVFSTLAGWRIYQSIYPSAKCKQIDNEDLLDGFPVARKYFWALLMMLGTRLRDRGRRGRGGGEGTYVSRTLQKQTLSSAYLPISFHLSASRFPPLLSRKLKLLRCVPGQCH